MCVFSKCIRKTLRSLKFLFRNAVQVNFGLLLITRLFTLKLELKQDDMIQLTKSNMFSNSTYYTPTTTAVVNINSEY